MFTSHSTRPLRWAIPLAVLGGIVAVRACVWSADTLHALREDVRRLHERLDGQS